MTEQAIDLDALAADLTAAGWIGEVTDIGVPGWREAMLWFTDQRHGSIRRHKLHLAIMNGVFSCSVASYVDSRLIGEMVQQDGASITSEPLASALDIIRRHVAPDAIPPLVALPRFDVAMRERIAEAIADSGYIGTRDQVSRATLLRISDHIADIVLRAMLDAAPSDGVVVPRDLASRAVEAFEFVARVASADSKPEMMVKARKHADALLVLLGEGE